MKADVIIIGSGLGGLACGHILASEGYRVLFLERQAQPGGCMQSYKRKGLEFDTGLHYVGGLGKGQPLHNTFNMLGLLKLPWVRLDKDCFDRIFIEGKSYDFAQGFDHFVTTLAKSFPEERSGLHKYVVMLRRSSVHEVDALDPAAKDNPLKNSSPFRAFTIPAWQWLHENFHDETLINVLSGNSTRFELRKDTLPLFTLAHINSSYIAGSWRLKGSGRLLVESLLNDIKANGGDIVCNAGVEQLVEKDGRIVAAKCSNGETYEGNLFISDVHPALTLDLVKESKLIRKGLRWRLHMLQNTYGILTVSLVIKPGKLKYVNHNDYVYAKANLWEDFERDEPVSGVMISYRVPEDGSDNVRQIDLLTPVTWEKCSQWEGTTIGRRGQEYDEWKERKAEECIRLAETAAPGLAASIETKYISTPLTYRDYTQTPEGSAYGLRKDCNNPLLTVISPRTPEPNLMLTGQSLMLHGVEGVTMTALLTCAEIIGKERMWAKIHGK